MQNRPRNYPFPFRLCPRKGSFSVASSFAATASDRAGLALSSPNKTASVTSGLFCSLGNARGLRALTFVGLKMACVMMQQPRTSGTSRLDELLTKLGCPHEIASVDSSSFGLRLGELIARSRSVPALNVRRSFSQPELRNRGRA